MLVPFVTVTRQENRFGSLAFCILYWIFPIPIQVILVQASLHTEKNATNRVSNYNFSSLPGPPTACRSLTVPRGGDNRSNTPGQQAKNPWIVTNAHNVIE